MNTLEVIAKRKSTRAYKPEQISENALDAILKAGMSAPVAMAKYDSLHITVVQREQLITRFFDEAQDAVYKTIGIRKSLDYGAKTLIVVSSLPPHREGMDYANGGIIIENIHNRLRIQYHYVQHVNLIACGICYLTGAVICNGEIHTLLQAACVSVSVFNRDNK